MDSWGKGLAVWMGLGVREEAEKRSINCAMTCLYGWGEKNARVGVYVPDALMIGVRLPKFCPGAVMLWVKRIL